MNKKIKIVLMFLVGSVLLISMIALGLFFGNKGKSTRGKEPMLQAHRGVATEFPENTMSAFQAAYDQGMPQ